MKAVVVLPMYNEQDNAALIVDHLETVNNKFSLGLHYLAVNDGSKDGTEKVLKGLEKKFKTLIVVSYPKNKGLGGALQEGIREANNRKFDVLIFMDADLTHDGNDIPKFLKEIEKGADLVLGSRFVKDGRMVGVPFLRVMVSKVGNIAGQLLLNIPVRDFTTGYRAAKKEVFEKITLTEKGFGIQLEETVKAAAAGFALREVPIVLTTRRFGSSKMIYNTKLVKSYFQLLRKCIKDRYGKSTQS